MEGIITVNTAPGVGYPAENWEFTAYGTSVDMEQNGFLGSAAQGCVTVFSEKGCGKLVPASTDGLAFYYTRVPADKNFTFQASVHVDGWTLSNGQDGFGLMAADRIGKKGDPFALWNNCYMALASRIEYFWDGERESDTGERIIMRLGVGSREKIGVTRQNLARLEAGDTKTVTEEFQFCTRTFETSAAEKGAGIYNLIGNASVSVEGTLEKTVTDMIFKICKNNTGYFVSYIDGEGRETVHEYYGAEALSQLDREFIYVGFFAARNARATFRDIVLEVREPAEDAPTKARPVLSVSPVAEILSGKFANQQDYELVFYANADGWIQVEGGEGDSLPEKILPGEILPGETEAAVKAVMKAEVKAAVSAADSVDGNISGCLYEGGVQAGCKVRIPLMLSPGKNPLRLTFQPREGFQPAPFQRLRSYGEIKLTHTVEYDVSDREEVYISPEGRPEGLGTREDPVDIYTAVQVPQPGQKLYLLEGTYHLDRPVILHRGINGTQSQRISLLAAPGACTRPVLDFGRKSQGLILAGDYWHLKFFAVTGTASCQRGMLVAGSHNIVEMLHIYKNGNTGLQISRLLDCDERSEWPSQNLILNCTSYLNTDPGHEDSDGFAAKITNGEGNVFEGCISAYNADDGFDLFAKLESGPIGSVLLRGCMAFKNGYLLDEQGREYSVGHGNGFKLGGSSLRGRHRLERSVAFANGEKGIDCNSCPDISVYDSIAFNNVSHNVAFFTSEAADTDFCAEGILSFKDGKIVDEKGMLKGDQLEFKGSQDPAKVLNSSNYFFEGEGAANRPERGGGAPGRENYRPERGGGALGCENHRPESGRRQVSPDWFISLDTATAIRDREKGICRREDGRIERNGFLELKKSVTEYPRPERCKKASAKL